MIVQQNCVYVLIEHTNKSKEGFVNWGVYPNFNAAYERLEELTQGKKIIDNGDHHSSVMFETVEVARDLRHKEYYGHCYMHRYEIDRKLLNVRDCDKLITPVMIDELAKENKEKLVNATYRHNMVIL